MNILNNNLWISVSLQRLLLCPSLVVTKTAEARGKNLEKPMIVQAIASANKSLRKHTQCFKPRM